MKWHYICSHLFISTYVFFLRWESSVTYQTFCWTVVLFYINRTFQHKHTSTNTVLEFWCHTPFQHHSKNLFHLMVVYYNMVQHVKRLVADIRTTPTPHRPWNNYGNVRKNKMEGQNPCSCVWERAQPWVGLHDSLSWSLSVHVSTTTRFNWWTQTVDAPSHELQMDSGMYSLV